MPVPGIWGPKLWDVLHSIGARGGRSVEKLQGDELRELKWLLEHLETIVPCAECRDHIVNYRKQNGIIGIASEIGVWVWKFHNAVNERLGKPVRSIESIETGQSVDVLEGWRVYQSVLKESMFKGSVRGEAIKDWNRHLRLWLGFAGL